MILIDDVAYSSKLRYKNASLKSYFAISSLLICLISRSFIIAGMTLVIMSAFIVYRGKTKWSTYLRLLKVPLAFLFLSIVSIVINISPSPLSPIAIPILGSYITVSYTSILYGLELISISFGCISCLYFLSLTTPMTDILMVLKKIHIPSIIIELMLLIYRFIFVLLDIAHSLSTSQKSRLGNKDFKTSCQSFGRLLSVLLVLSFKKSSYLYDAMESRCYNGTICVLEETYPMEKKELFFVLLINIIFIMTSIFLRINSY